MRQTLRMIDRFAGQCNDFAHQDDAPAKRHSEEAPDRLCKSAGAMLSR
jgi:hypothetical protein